MRSLLLAVAAALLYAAPAVAVSGGDTVDISTVPFVASTGGCTGTLIAPDRVLTAAHCVNDSSGVEFFVTVGADAGSENVPRSAVYTSTGVSIAPGFKLSFPFAHKRPQNAIAVNDVALVILDKPVANATPVTVAGPDDAAQLEQPGTPARLLGYGITKPFKLGSLPPRTPLQGGDLKLIGRAGCLKAYPHAVTVNEICARDDDRPLTQPCPGDSGGPLLVQTPNGPVQVGITSWGAEVKEKDCGVAHLPAVWMRVSKYHDFITAPDPPLRPNTRGKVTLSGKTTLTCHAPAFKGSESKLSYRWGIPRYRGHLIQDQPHPINAIKGATSNRFTRTSRTRGKKIACEVTASNGGGKWTVYSPSVAG